MEHEQLVKYILAPSKELKFSLVTRGVLTIKDLILSYALFISFILNIVETFY